MSRGRGPGFLAGALFGGLVGGALGVLLAPRSGEETRRELRERGEAAGSADTPDSGLDPGSLAAGLLAAAQERLETALAEARVAAEEARRSLAKEWAERNEGRAGSS